MKTTRFFVFTLLFGTLLWLPESLAQTVNIPDANLRAVIAETLDKQPNVLLTRPDMARLRHLNAHNRDISDLTGLESATNLQEIRAHNNLITDLSPLAGLSRLNVIEFRDNVISDLSPLVGLINLRSLDVHNNLISDLSPIADLVLLDRLDISQNAISDFSPLAGLTKLENIRFSENPFADLSDLTGLTSLRRLHTWGTPVVNLEAIRTLPKLQVLDICGGEISDLTPLAGLTNLTELSLVGNEITDITPVASLRGLKILNLRHNQVSDVSPIASLLNLQTIDLHDNEILDFSPLDGFPKNVSIVRSENPGFIQSTAAAPKIEGPWLWIILPTGNVPGSRAAASQQDYLSEVSGGQVTEQQIATEGAMEGNRVGDKVWTVGELPRNGPNNINDMVNAIGLGTDNIDFHVAYGSIALDVVSAQESRFFVGSGDAVKVWLNGKQVHKNPVDRDAEDYQEDFPVTLKEGRNILLVAVYEGEGWWSGFFGLNRNTEYTTALPNRFLVRTRRVADIDGDGTVSIFDMILVARRFGTLIASKPGGSVNEDINGDGVVNISDLILVVQHINEPISNDPAAPAPELIQQWIDLAWTEYDGSLEFQKGITNLENILMALKSEKTEPKTALFANYPNPFNPETWIPYQLAVSTEVVLTIWTTTGRIVRTLPLGHQSTGVYKTPNRAAHWDGKNHLGESVTSGIYFYTLTAGDFTATRKMLIRK